MKKDHTEAFQRAVDNLMEMYKNGTMPEAIAWSIIRRRQGDVGIPSDKWSIGNQVLMYQQGTMDARGFKQWETVGRHVKKGSKAIYILAPCTIKVKVKEPKPGEEENRVIITGFRPLPVFKLEDTDGEPVPVVDYTPEKLPPLWDAAKNLGISVTYSPMYRPALGSYKIGKDQISLYAEDAAVYFHELAHNVDHRYLHNLLVRDDALAEITAEFSAMTLCQITQIDGYEKQGFDYISNYAKNKKSTPEQVLKLIMGVLSDVEKIVNIILDAAEGVVPEK